MSIVLPAREVQAPEETAAAVRDHAAHDRPDSEETDADQANHVGRRAGDGADHQGPEARPAHHGYQHAEDGRPRTDPQVRKVLRFIRILTLTTESQQAKRDEAKKLGATGCMAKPLAAADLVKVIRHVLPGA
jgi:DNA-binding NarL/FixJ family response regulator